MRPPFPVLAAAGLLCAGIAHAPAAHAQTAPGFSPREILTSAMLNAAEALKADSTPDAAQAAFLAAAARRDGCPESHSPAAPTAPPA